MTKLKYALRNNNGKFIHTEWDGNKEEVCYTACDLNNSTAKGILYDRKMVADVQRDRLPYDVQYYSNEPLGNFEGVEVVEVVVKTVYEVI